MVLASFEPDPAKQQALSQALALTVVVASLLVVVVIGVFAYSVLRRRRERLTAPPLQPSKKLDAWAAAADRVSYQRRGDEFEEDEDESEVDESTWYDEDTDDESSWDEDNDESDSDDLSEGGSSSGPVPPRPTSGPLPPEDTPDDDSFNDDDIPGSRIDWKPKGP